MKLNFAVVLPLANEEQEFQPFFGLLAGRLASYPEARAYLVIDTVSKDRTLELCRELEQANPQFRVVFEPKNRNVVDAYIRGYREAIAGGHDYIIEMDAGNSHDPAALPLFLDAFEKGYACVYGSRFIPGGKMDHASIRRSLFSKGGTLLANMLLGTRLHDMTSGYQGFSREVAEKFANYPLRSTAHFYQTELRYLLRNYRGIEVPIVYRAPSPSVRPGAIKNSFITLFHYFLHTRQL